MAIVRPKTESHVSPRPNSVRRCFIRNTGAALSALVASAAVGFSKSPTGPGEGSKDEIARLSKRIGSLEDADAIRKLHRAYQSRLDQGLYEEVIGMFADDAEVIYNGGLFSGKEGIRRLYCDYFASGLTGRAIEPAPGFDADPAQQHDVIEVAAGRESAVGRFPYSMQVGTPMTGDSSLVEMARLQGEGIVMWGESGTQEAAYVKASDTWKIRRLEYRPTARADYRPGRAHARPIDVPSFSSVFPANPAGPDQLV
jgi:hypothetical protein